MHACLGLVVNQLRPDMLPQRDEAGDAGLVGNRAVAKDLDQGHASKKLGALDPQSVFQTCQSDWCYV